MAKRAAMIAGTVLAMTILVPGGGRASAGMDESPDATTVCTWGGTPADTTGTLTIKPGLTFTPSTEDLKFVATGELAGGPGCAGTMTFDGVIEAGGTCEWLIFDGKVKGVPGVERFYGPGLAGFIHEFLYDEDGNVVGSDQPQVWSGAGGEGSEVSDCNTPEGFTDGIFSSTVEFYF